MQGTAFLPLRRAGVLALSLRGGTIRPHGVPEDPELDSFDLVPSAERFYAGGRTTHRAFSRDELGVPGETLFVEPGEDPVPLGGGALALLNAEWRFPIAGALTSLATGSDARGETARRIVPGGRFGDCRLSRGRLVAKSGQAVGRLQRPLRGARPALPSQTYFGAGEGRGREPQPAYGRSSWRNA